MKVRTATRGFFRIAALMTVVVAALVLLTREGLLTLSALRAFSSGAAHWIHAEKEVVHHLGRHIRHPNSGDWAVYEANMQVLRASHEAIVMSRDFDVEAEPFDEALRRLGHTARDASLLSRTSRLIWKGGPARRPLEIWFASDTLVTAIERVAREVGPPAELGGGRGVAPDTARALAELSRLDGTIDERLDEFTRELSRADHLTRRLLMAVVSVSGLLLLAGALTLTHHTLRQVEESEEARERSEESLQILLRQTPLYLWTVDRDLILRTVSGGDAEGWQRFVGTSLPRLLETTTANARALDAHRKALEGGSSDYDTRWDDRAFNVHVEPLRDHDGRIVGAVGVALDATNRIRIEEERARLEEQLWEAQKMDAVGRLAGGIAHDFNNLLTVIRGNVSLLELEGPGSDGELRQIDEAAEKAQHLVRQLLAFSRRDPSSPRALELSDIIPDMEPMLRSILGESVHTSIRVDEDLPVVVADPRQLEQVMLNLALNARDAMPDGGTLTVAMERVFAEEGRPCRGCPVDVVPGSYVHLTVRDDGSGIDPEDLPRIFEPFYSTKDPREGSGLGLAMVYGVVKQSEGFVWAQSEPQRGTCIHILLPAAEEEAAQEAVLSVRSASTS